MGIVQARCPLVSGFFVTTLFFILKIVAKRFAWYWNNAYFCTSNHNQNKVMQKYKITYPDGTTKEFQAIEHNGSLCSQFSVQDGYEYRKRRTNPGFMDDDEPEYETVRKPKYRTEHKPFLNRTALQQDGMLQKAETCVKKAKSFSDYSAFSTYFLRIGENIGGIKIELV